MENKSEILNDSCIDLVAVDTTSAARPPKPNDKMVSFCCATNLPGDFKLVNNPDNDAKILYDLRNLSCKIEPRCSSRQGGSCSCSSFDIIVVGSIPFIANATVAVGTNCSTASTCPIKISCGCVVPVNETVCNVCSYEAAIKACALLEVKLRNCNSVTPINVKAIQGINENSCSVIFTGKLKLPDCM
jgi:hypothetical protein